MSEKQFNGVEHTGELDNPQSNTEDVLHSLRAPKKHNASGLVLVPQPSDDPRDPLYQEGPVPGRASTRKGIVLALVCLAAFSALLQALANSSGFLFQALLYHKTAVEVSYCISAAIAGIVVGPLIFTPVACRFGKAFVLFWTMILTMTMNIWSACMNRETQYIPFILSRLFAGLFGSPAITLGSKFIVEVFFLHDRGKCFALYTFCILQGGIVCITLSGYIVERVAWPWQFWYNVIFEAFIAMIMFFFLEETLWTRPGQTPVPLPPQGLLQRKFATYFLTKRLTPKQTKQDVMDTVILPFKIAACPVTILIGSMLLVYYAFGIAINTFLSIFLQTPVEQGGYGFSPDRNASFTFVLWFGAIVAELHGWLLSDRLPLWICERKGGVWNPEYRLHSTWIPLFICFPLGLGLFGASLRYHWDYMVLALATFLETFGAIAAFPPLLNYVVESFNPSLANEVAASINLYRVSFAISVTFFLFPWSDRLGINWVFGMMALFVVVWYLTVIACMIWGEKIRAASFVHAKSESGIQIVDDEPDVET